MPSPMKKTLTGHSVCNACGKGMLHARDVVCHVCHRTFCYNHVQAVKGHWLCLDCRRLLASR